MKLRIKHIPKVTLRRIIRDANADSDPASVFVLDDFEGCILVLKGKRNTARLRQFLLDAKLIKPGKGITTERSAVDWLGRRP